MCKTALVSLLLILYSLGSHLVQAESLKLISPLYCPMVCDPEVAGGQEGFVVDILKRIFEPEGYTLEIEFFPYTRVLHMVETDNYRDGVVLGGAVHLSKMIIPKRMVAPQRVALFVTNGDAWTFEGIQSLKSKSIAIVQNFGTPDKKVDRYLAETSLSEVYFVSGDDPTKRIFGMLLNDRIDVAIEGELIAHYQFHVMDISEKVVHAGFLSGVFHNTTAFSPQHPNGRLFAGMVESGLIDLRKSGVLEEILNNYGLPLWPEDIEIRR